MALIIALPTIACLLFSSAKLRQHEIEEALSGTTSLCERVLSEQQSIAASAEQLMATLALMPEVEGHDAPDMCRILAEIVRMSPLYQNLLVVDRDGLVWASALATGSFSIADRRHFKNAMATGRLSSGEFGICRITLRPTINLCYPFRDKTGAIAGAIVAGLRLDRLLPKNDENFKEFDHVILDHRGVVVGGGTRFQGRVGTAELPGLFAKMQQGPFRGEIRGVDFDGRMRFISYRKLRLKGEQEPYLYVCTSIPVQTVDRLANEVMAPNLGIFVICLTIFFILAWRVGKRSLLDPVCALKSASRRLAGGDLQVRVSALVQGGELGELGRTFDEMAQHLLAREQERAATEKSLRASEERLRLFFERQLVGMAIGSSERGWIKTNKKFHVILGYSAEELNRLFWQELVHPADLPRALIYYEKLLAGGLEEFSVEVRMVRKDGAVLFTEISIGCVRQPCGAVDYLLILLDDITPRKNAEHEIELLHSLLEQRVLERTEQLESAIREQESFSYSVSHDLRSPLRHINSYLSIFIEDHGSELMPEARFYLDRARSASVRMGKLIDDLLQLSKVGRSELVKENVNLTELATAAAAMFRESEPGRSLEVVIADNLTARGDRVLMNQVLVNLLGNAWKYTARIEKPRLEVGAREEDGQTVFFVRDNGTGFDMTYQDKLFRPFQRLHGDEYEGNGIGLATVARIMERHGGEVWAEAAPGEGATFYLVFP